ncbi:RNA polymerase sigma factor [Actinoplanes subglobosus]|uniref:RNA polymerase sigma factor n=1 Tax=Actinoplanes subglobosus TaxID=1547892 RepID=A0ABV8J7Q4_9ACTN
MPDRSSTDAAFTDCWKEAKSEVIKFCRSSAGRLGEAEELYQRVMIRAWRGFPSFRGDAAFLTWVLRIARREAARLGAERGRITQAETPLENLGDAEPAVPAEEPPGDAGWIRAAVSRAVTAGALSPGEGAVLEARLDHPDESWEKLGVRLGAAAGACAVAHLRAVPKLRVFVLETDPGLVAGPDALAAAYRRALVAAQPLTEAEAEAFRMVILQRRSGYRRVGWRTALRAACAKVVENLEESSADR